MHRPGQEDGHSLTGRSSPREGAVCPPGALHVGSLKRTRYLRPLWTRALGRGALLEADNQGLAS